jgi:hypothetical protein
MVVPPGFTSLRTRNPLLEWLFRRNYQLMNNESAGGMVTPPGITSAGIKNLAEEWDFARNKKLIYEESTRAMGFCRELLAHAL